MSLPQGTLLGSYRIVAPIGAGGMGEVYRARDPELNRDVAIKVLLEGFARDGDRVRRFRQEARTLATLNHPNLVQIFEFGDLQGVPYLVMELLDGETLREKLTGRPLSPRRAGEYAREIAQGLAAAHDQGILHRDLKPENVFITREGRVKLLDFGLAKAWTGSAINLMETQSLAEIRTGTGQIAGTMRYMSPEQVLGEQLDPRSDLFSLGLILWEMVTGRHPFERPSGVEIMHAILKDEPPDLDPALGLTPSWERILHSCLAKEAGGRFHSAHDLAFALEFSASAGGSSSRLDLKRVRGARHGTQLWAAGLGAAAALAAVAGLWGFSMAPFRRPSPPVFQRMTFGQGLTDRARFTPDGRSVVYSRHWDGVPIQVFTRELRTMEERPFGPPESDILGFSREGEAALCLHVHDLDGNSIGTLSRTFHSGNLAPRELVSDVSWAEFAPDGRMAIVRKAGDTFRLEFPVGTVLAQTRGWFSYVRFSPEGDAIAYQEHPEDSFWDDRGHLVLLDLKSGKSRLLAENWVSILGMAWKGREIWFTGWKGIRKEEPKGERTLYAATRSGQIREVLHLPQNSRLEDISQDGRVLLSCEFSRYGLLSGIGDKGSREDLGRFDLTFVMDFSDDGKTFILREVTEQGGKGYRHYLRHRGAPSPSYIGDSTYGMQLSRDSAWVVTLGESGLELLPTGPGEVRQVSAPGIVDFHGYTWAPDGKLWVSGMEKGKGYRVYLLDPDQGKLSPLTPEGYSARRHSPDWTQLLLWGDGGPALKGKWFCLDLKRPGSPPLEVHGLDPKDHAPLWYQDSRHLLVWRGDSPPIQVWTLDPATGRRESLGALNLEGFIGKFEDFRICPDGQTWFGTWSRPHSDLYLVEGLR